MTTTSAPHHTNRLIHASSPYLLQHAHNPVDWYEWGREALDKAKREDKPIFLSIGYSACHWCHVMERESFENDDVAAILNQHFVSIKVDREERPDIDDLYMKATQLYNRGGGGWPMSVWLTPDLKPFVAGTYFPPESRYGRPGFKDILRQIADLWRSDRGRVTAGADQLTEAVKQFATTEGGGEIIPHSTIAQCVGLLAGAFDPVRGGMAGGGTNKFPPSMAMDLMLRVHHYSLSAPPGTAPRPQTRLLELVRTTLDHMAGGGIYDQLGGGIARYSTDEDWLVPHFEKMLYDQALVGGIYLDAFQATGEPLYARIAGEICDYVRGDLQSAEGGYYSTRDADSEGHEGKYYVWSKPEVLAALGPADGELFCSYYDVSDDGNWEGGNILHVPRSAETVAKLNRVSETELLGRVADGRRKLLALRAGRVPPHLDDKVLSGWNGLMIATMARASRVLERPDLRESAGRAAEFVLTRMRRDDGRLWRTYRQGKARIEGYLEDHAFMVEALLNLYEATFDLRWLDEAERLNGLVMKHFRDAEQGGFFLTADDAEQVLVRQKEAGDNAIPSGNSVQLMNLLRLSVLLNKPDLWTEAERFQRAFQKSLAAHPASSERMLAAVDFYHRRPREIVLVFPDGIRDDDPLLRAAWRTYVPNRVMVGARAADMERLARRIPLLADRTVREGRTTAYVCENFTCKAPTTEAEILAKQLRP